MSSIIFDLIEEEKKRQIEGLEMIPSENYASKNVLTALGSILTNKYSEGYAGKRYYAGNEVIDKIEKYTRELANKAFGTEYAIVQPYSGSPANLATTIALAEPGETTMGLKLTSGGHLTHGAADSLTGKLYNNISYTTGEDGRIDLKEIQKLAREHRPKFIWVGTTAYPYILDYAGFAEIADEIGAYLVADVAHISGLIVAGVHPSPVPFVHVVTTTTHKTLRGPRGAMILVTKKGIEKDPDLPMKLEKAVFPGLQGGPHNHQTAAIAIALEEALTDEFKEYAGQIVKNAKILAKELGVETETHLMNLNLTKYGFGLGYQLQIALEIANIATNRNTVRNEPASAFYPSGLRIGTPALTTRGMKEEDMLKVADWIKQVIEVVKGHDLPKELEKRKDFMKEFRAKMKKDQNLLRIKKEVSGFARKFPVPGIS